MVKIHLRNHRQLTVGGMLLEVKHFYHQNIDQNFDFTMLHDRMKIFMEDMIARNGTNADVVEATQSHWSSRFSSGIVGAFIGVVIFGGIAFFKLLIRTFRKN